MKDLMEASPVVVRQLKRQKDEFDDQSQDEFASFPCGIAFFHLIYGGRLLSERAVVGVQGRKISSIECNRMRLNCSLRLGPPCMASQLPLSAAIPDEHRVVCLRHGNCRRCRAGADDAQGFVG
jgi:hypothetical protein